MAETEVVPDQAVYDALLADDLNVNTQLSTWEMLRRTAQRVPENDALITGDTHITYQELAGQSLRAAAALADLGVGRGTRVAFQFHPCPDWGVLHYALARLGAVGVPINTSYMATELEHLFTLAQPELLITVDRFRDADMAARLFPVVARFDSIAETVVLPLDEGGWVAPSPERDLVYGSDGGNELSPTSGVGGDDPAYIIFTSGSTAAPKPVLIAHRGMVGAATGLQHALGLVPEDRFVASNPVFHTGGIVWNLTMPHLVGMTSCLVGVYETGKVLREMERSKITVMGAFDTKLTMMRNAPEYHTVDRSSVRKCNVGASGSFLRSVLGDWNWETVAQVYGSTESGGLGSITPRYEIDPKVRYDANGRPMPGMEFVIKDPETGHRCAPDEPGEICFQGWGTFIEYVGMPEATAEAFDDEGFFHSGDYGFMDAAGNLYFRGRYKLMIKTGGENVSEREVEIFCEDNLDAVKFAIVVGVPDPLWGEAVVAFVELHDGAIETSDNLVEACRGRIANFKIPKRFLVVGEEDWPLLDSGRPDRHELRARAAALMGAEGETRLRFGGGTGGAQPG
ncbi:MAG: acyl--CoA ligase [Acidimicrobiia bacterium]|nr:acyl--CoA ligase [Acidimicrobiia bacterium]MCY4435253.1 class I adenylate-forming enzyme family protein [bacterium]